MKKAKIFIVASILSLSLFFLVGCGNNGTGNQEPNTIRLLVSDVEVAESTGWSFEEFVKHAESTRSYSAELHLTTQN